MGIHFILDKIEIIEANRNNLIHHIRLYTDGSWAIVSEDQENEIAEGRDLGELDDYLMKIELVN